MEMESLKARPIASSNYVRSWTAWEAFREVYCNALDADQAGMIVDYPGKDTVCIFTRTAPSFHECCVVGEGSKDPGSGTIGQFGEGLKLAALTVVRTGGSLHIRTPDFTATYELRTEPGARYPILYLVPRRVPTKQSRPGCLITLKCPSVEWRSFRANFTDGKETFIPCASTDDKLRIYCKGVLISQQTDTPSLFHYNLNELSINRDRSLASSWSVSCNIVQSWCARLERSTSAGCAAADELLSISDKHIENRAFNDYSTYRTSYPKAVSILATAVRSKYGEDCVLPCDDEPTNQYAALRGVTVLRCLSSGIRAFLTETIPDASSLITKNWKPDPLTVLSPAQGHNFDIISLAFRRAIAAVPAFAETFIEFSIHPFDSILAPPNASSILSRPDDSIPGRVNFYIGSDVLDSSESNPNACGALISMVTTLLSQSSPGTLKKELALGHVAGHLALALPEKST